MRGGTVQINWHDTKPVLTLDFHPLSGLLATGGADFDIKLWLIGSDEGSEKKIPTATYQNSLSYHGCAVNALRFSPSGEQLASGADGGELILWKLYVSEAGQTWKVFKTLSFHRKDVLDLQWSNDGAFLVSGSVDNSCIIWDANKATVHQILDAHFHYVQGVAWDPLSKYVASLSSDRTCRVYMNKPTKAKGIEKTNYVCQHVISKAEQQSVDDSKSAKNHLFHDETLPSFFRRLAWSPDGTFLLVPAGSYKASAASAPVNTAYIFSRKDLSRPALQLPGASKPVIAVRFCPITFCLRGTNSAGFFKLPYRLIFAVATLNSLYIYDTESVPPIAVLAGLHYAAITDIAWSQNGQYLALSSQDGYCTLVEFENGELGSPISSPADKSKSPVVKTTDEMIIETPKSDGKSKSPIVQKQDEMMIETTRSDCSVAADDGKTGTDGNTEQNVNIADKCKNPVVQKPDDMVIETTRIQSSVPGDPKTETSECIVTGNDRKTEADTNAGKQVSSSKPAKRRITPMAIDP